MNDWRDPAEPISPGRRDLRAAERRALVDVLWFAVLFGGVVLVNGILAIFLIEFLQTVGLWEVATPQAPETPAQDPTNRLRGWRPAAAAD